MSNKPRKQKKYSVERNYARAAKHVIKPLAIAYTLKNTPKVLHASTGATVSLSEAIYKAFHTVQHHWTVYTVVLLETITGERYANIKECSPVRACYKEDISDLLKEKHIEHVAETRKADRVNIGWVAYPVKCDVSEADIVSMLEVFDDCWTRHERGGVLLDEELSVDQQLERALA